MSALGLASLSLVSAGLTLLSLPSFDFGVLGWCALAPLLFALRRRGLLAAAALGLLFGYGFGAGAFAWLNAVPAVTPLRYSLLVLAFSAYYAVFAVLYAASNRVGPSWMILGAPVVWVALEYARASMSFLALPWNFLGHSQYRYLPVIQVADVLGAYGVSFLLVMANECASRLPDALAGRQWRWRAQALAFVVAVAATLLYGGYRLAAAPETGERLRVAIVQANVTTRSGMSVKDQLAHLATYGRLTTEAARDRPALIVWPSSSLPGPMSFWVVRLYVANVAHRTGAHLLVGGAGGDKLAPPRGGRLPFSNSEFLVSPSGAVVDEYSKRQLTPFTEYVPLRGVVRWPRWLTTAEASFVPGGAHTLFRVSGARFGAPICWENAFPDLFRRFVRDGANVMMSVTNEGAFGASAPHQTLAMNVFRAVENRVAIVRAATTGVSGFIDARGKIVARVTDDRGKDVSVAGRLVWDVPLSERKTFYTLHGDVFARAVSAAAGVLAAFAVFASRRAYAPSPEPAQRPESVEAFSP